jgi:hypothetical protein
VGLFLQKTIKALAQAAQKGLIMKKKYLPIDKYMLELVEIGTIKDFGK